MTLNYTLEKKHHQAFQTFHFYNSKLGTIFFCFIFIMVFVETSTSTTINLVYPLLFAGLTVLIFRLLVSLFIIWRTNSMISSDRSALGDFQLSFDDDNIIETSAVSVANFNYSLVSRLIYRRKCLFIYLEKTRAILIPDSTFQHSEAAIAFLDLIYEKTGKRLRQSDYSKFILAVKDKEPVA